MATEGADIGAARFVADSFKKSFGRKEVLKAASTWAVPGRITLLIGRNGSGKSTLLEAALGLISADLGTARWEGEVRLRPRLHELARLGLFYLPDDGLLSRRLRVGEHVAAIRRRFGDPRRLFERDPLEIRWLESRHTNQLSGGERRRVELTLALMRAPACLLADEPLLGLAPKHQKTCTAEIRALAGEGCAVLVTGHETEWLLDFVDEVHWLVAGGTYVLGSPAEAREHQQFRHEYLGPREAGTAAPPV